jgi:hypothetical protein
MSTEQILVTSFENDLSWLSNVPESIGITIYNNNLNRRIITRYGFGYFKIPVNCASSRAKIINKFNNEDINAIYLSYILDNYYNLPDKIIIGNYEKTLSKEKIIRYTLDEISQTSNPADLLESFLYDEPIYTPVSDPEPVPAPPPSPESIPEETPTPESPSVLDDENILAMPNVIMEKFI